MTSRGSRVNLAYQLTAIGASMPGLFVENEIDTAPDNNQAKDEPPCFR